MAVTGNLKNANFPMDGEGRVYHLTLKSGELANRILCVGDPQRALLLVQFFDNPQKIFTRASSRGFITYTGTVDGVPLSIMSIGMGIPMVDFMVREARQIVSGPMCIIRLGTCGTPNDEIPMGSVVVTRGSACVTTDYSAYYAGRSAGSALKFYNVTEMIEGDTHLRDKLKANLLSHIKDNPVLEADDITADSFYSSQGRIDSEFDDNNQGLIDEILEKYPNIGSLQMETYQLFHLCNLSKGSIKSAACAIVLAQRKTNYFLEHEKKHLLEKLAGKACLQTLAHWKEGDALNLQRRGNL